MENLLGTKVVIKATEVWKGDFLVGDNGLSTYEVIDVQVQPAVVLVDLAVKGVVRLDPTWDVAVFRKEGTGGVVQAKVKTRRQIVADDDSAWCINCNRDTAFCLCVCDVCYEDLEDCQCKCAQCDTLVQGGYLCEMHEASWDKSVQGPKPKSSEEVGECESCGIPFNSVLEIDPIESSRSKFTHLRRHSRKVCLRCNP